MSSSDAASRADAVATFRAVTQVPTDAEAEARLTAAGWDLERAVNAFLSPTEIVSSPAHQGSADVAPHRSSGGLRRRGGTSEEQRNSGEGRADQNENGQRRASANRGHRGTSPPWLMAIFSPLRVVWAAVARIADVFFSLLGGSARAIEAAPGDTPTRRFLSFLDSRYGTTRPTFYDGSYFRALAHAQAEVKFLMVYLHSDSHRLSRAFLNRILAHPDVISTVNENFICWAGSITQQDAAAAQHALRVNGFPFLGIVAPPRATVRVPTASNNHSGYYSGRAQLPTLSTQNYGLLLGSRSGAAALSSDDPGAAATSWMMNVLGDHSRRLDAVRQERAARESERLLRMEQDQEYARALEEDRARERAKAEEEEKKRREKEEAERLAREEEERVKAREERRERKREALGDEPEKSPDVANIVIRLPDGQKASRRFAKTAMLGSVFDWAEVNSVDIELACLVSSYPRRSFGYPEDAETTIEDAGLHPSAMLLLEERSNTDM